MTYPSGAELAVDSSFELREETKLPAICKLGADAYGIKIKTVAGNAPSRRREIPTIF
jgi:hypothetical protein